MPFDFRSQHPEHGRGVFTRREFLHTAAAAGAAVWSGVSPVRAAKYDLLVKGGQLLDPAFRQVAVRDVGIAGGRITAVEASLAAADAASTIDAAGKLVVPGLIDIHTHVRSKEMPSICLANGVTSLLDAGSQGVDRIDEVIAAAEGAANRVRILLNIARTGILPDGELMDISRVDVAAAQKVIAAHRDVIVGVKARLSRTVAGKNDVEALRRAQAITGPMKLPVMIHMGDTVSPLPDLLALLKPGDIVTHMYAPPPHGIFDDAGRVLPEVIAARKRGIWFDVGNGRVAHINWAEAERGLQQKFLPDTISSDWTEAGRTDQVFDFPNVLSKFLLLGLPVGVVIGMGTANAARAVASFKDLGTLRVGAIADVAILELRQGTFEFVDNYNNTRTGTQKLFTTAAIIGGKQVGP
jgi:dihydroorotase